MSVFIPSRWARSKRDQTTRKYATQAHLLNYFQRDAEGNLNLSDKQILNLGPVANAKNALTQTAGDGRYLQLDGSSPITGDVDLGKHKLTNVKVPTDPLDAINKKYFHRNLPKPIVAVTGEHAGSLYVNARPFSFGASSYVYSRTNGGATPGKNGVALPTAGRILYLTICCTNSSGNRPPGGADIAVLINDVASQQSAVLAGSITTSVVTFNPPLSFSAGDKINFISKKTQEFSFTTIAAAFAELS